MKTDAAFLPVTLSLAAAACASAPEPALAAYADAS